MNNPSPTLPEPIQFVCVQRHRVDWEASDIDLADLTAQRAVTLAPQIATGCWFLNPRYTVSSSAPSAKFFRTVLRLRSTWLRTCRQIMGNSGQRHLARLFERRGRLGALLPLDLDDAAVDQSVPREELVLLSELSPDRRREVIEAGQLAKSLGSSGILLIDGQVIPHKMWQAQADRLTTKSASTSRRPAT
jgi:hypothetical protein